MRQGNTNMNAIEKLRAKIANGEISTGKKASVPVGEGSFKCIVAEAEYKENQAKTAFRGMVKYRVQTDVTGDEVECAGGLFNTYVSTANPEYMEKNIATYVQVLMANGFSEDKIYDDAETLEEVVQNIMILLDKAAKRNKEVIVHVKRKQQDKLSPQGKPQYWNDILESTWTGEVVKPEGTTNTEVKVENEAKVADAAKGDAMPWED